MMRAIINYELMDDSWPYPRLHEAWERGDFSTWFEVTEHRMMERLEILPPIYCPGGFYVCEPYTNDARGIPVYTCVVSTGGHHYMQLHAGDLPTHLDRLSELFEAEAPGNFWKIEKWRNPNLSRNENG